MMFAIIENIREFLIEKNDVFVEQKIKEDEERRLKEENKSTMYTTEKKIEFNRETFTKWLKDFGEERKKLKLEALKNRTKEEIERDERMTGKAYFQQKQHISGSGIVFDDDEIDKILEDDPSAADEPPEEDEERKDYFDEDLFDDEGEGVGDEIYFEDDED
mmetsp:Transcript_37185/g.42703  ORF Transcript_37185/g.42703 Transcript_37185/m.42703 type:complete len:161 (-) Transcript_37185:52-534(-)